MDNEGKSAGIQAKLNKDQYFNHGNQYFVTFKYGSDEQKRRIYEAFENGLIPAYGAHSQRAKEGKDFIMPYFADKEGNMTTQTTGVIGGTNIPKDLLTEFIKRFVEYDGMNVSIGNENIHGKFDEDKFNDMVENIGIKATLNKGDYFNHGDQYFVTFKYDSDEQKRRIYEAFENGLIPAYGAHSLRAKEGKDFIMPYFADKEGNMTTLTTGVIGGTNIPKELLSEFIRRFVEYDGMNVSIGDDKIKEHFDKNKFDKMLEKFEKDIDDKNYDRLIEEKEEREAKEQKEKKFAELEAEMLEDNKHDESRTDFDDENPQGLTENEMENLDEANIDRENDDKIFSRAEDYTPDELEQMSNEDLEKMLVETKAANQAKRNSLEEVKKKELITKIRAAVEEGKELDAQIAAKQTILQKNER